MILIICRQSLINTLKEIHQAGVLHGDIELRNMCSTSSGEAYIIDFSHAEKNAVKVRRGAGEKEVEGICELLGIQQGKTRSKAVVSRMPQICARKRRREAAPVKVEVDDSRHPLERERERAKRRRG